MMHLVNLAGTHSSPVCYVSVFERMRLGYSPLPTTTKRGGGRKSGGGSKKGKRKRRKKERKRKRRIKKNR